MPRGSCAICHATYAGGERFCPLDGGAIVEDATDDPLIGKTLDGRYLVRRLVGRGGMGAVYEAHHVGLDKRVAIKFVIDAGKDALARFRREARAASRIAHEHVVQIFDVGSAEGRDYLVMEYLDGRDLRTVLEPGPMPVARAVPIAMQILDGLHAIHEAGIVHRDIKPGNILLLGPDDTVKIMDFGISMMDVERTERVTQSGQVIGTPQFMAPEQLMGAPVDRRADLYAVGLTLYAMLTGDVPFSGTSVVEIAAQQQRGPVPAVPNVPAHVARTIARALARDPEDRFATARDFAGALGEVAPERGAGASMPTVSEGPALERDAPTSVERRRPAPGPSRRLKWLAAVSLVVFAAVVVVLIASPGQGHDTRAPVDAAAAVPDDPLAGARAAEHDGKLELAIARYLERYEAVHDPQLLFRIGELYERLDRVPDAVLYFRRYLDAAPRAADRAAVEARIARLTPPPPIDAGAPADADSRPHRPGDRIVAHASPPDARPEHHDDVPVEASASPPETRPTTPVAADQVDPRCRCIPDDPAHRLNFLCQKTYPARCLCELEENELCATEFQPCPAPCPHYAVNINDLYWKCSAPTYHSYVLAKAGAPCKGFSDQDLSPDPHETKKPVLRTGAWRCNSCIKEPFDGDRNFEIPGKAGDRCQGFLGSTGQLLTGHVVCQDRW